ncbi:VOC family protein [Chitinilyticum piscinae]|uniref:VOC family protein n=1 Tax=Chitinilyticum piscinae TaxID=2866724 RepID=A0A8J7FJJ9_9NEIS|nr:VOC family protein [Chitinilyticum piscinae]MBE9609090.1 VOC family protein [Chitinilyticum piscinae]
MQNYVTLGANDYALSCAFYDAVLATIGWRSHVEFPGWRAYSLEGRGEGLVVWVASPFDGQPATAGNGSMLGFAALSHEQVERFHAAALAHGGRDEGAPGLRAHYGPHWYAAYVRDPVGNKLAIVCNQPAACTSTQE